MAQCPGCCGVSVDIEVAPLKMRDLKAALGEIQRLRTRPSSCVCTYVYARVCLGFPLLRSPIFSGHQGAARIAGKPLFFRPRPFWDTFLRWPLVTWKCISRVWLPRVPDGCRCAPEVSPEEQRGPQRTPFSSSTAATSRPPRPPPRGAFSLHSGEQNWCVKAGPREGGPGFRIGAAPSCICLEKLLSSRTPLTQWPCPHALPEASPSAALSAPLRL